VRARLDDGLRLDVAVVGRERLPLDGQEAVALQVAERAVIGHDVEAVAGSLEGAPRFVTAVRPLAHVGAQHRGAVVG